VAFKPIFKNLPERSKIDSQMAIITNPNLSSLDTNILRNASILGTVATFNSNQA
jgi:hypothetical protein